MFIVFIFSSFFIFCLCFCSHLRSWKLQFSIIQISIVMRYAYGMRLCVTCLSLKSSTEQRITIIKCFKKKNSNFDDKTSTNYEIKYNNKYVIRAPIQSELILRVYSSEQFFLFSVFAGSLNLTFFSLHSIFQTKSVIRLLTQFAPATGDHNIILLV